MHFSNTTALPFLPARTLHHAHRKRKRQRNNHDRVYCRSDVNNTRLPFENNRIDGVGTLGKNHGHPEAFRLTLLQMVLTRFPYFLWKSPLTLYLRIPL